MQPAGPSGPYTLLSVLGIGRGSASVHLARTEKGARVAVRVIRREFAADSAVPGPPARGDRHRRAGPRPAGGRGARRRPRRRRAVAGHGVRAGAVAARGPRPLRPAVGGRRPAARASGWPRRSRRSTPPGAVHGDLKPANVLVAGRRPAGHDVGIARAAAAPAADPRRRARRHARLPRPRAAPRTAGPSPPSDVFALGSVLLLAATWRAPFGDGRRRRRAAPRAAGRPGPGGLTADIAPVVAACLRRNPAAGPARPGARDLAAPGVR